MENKLTKSISAIVTAADKTNESRDSKNKI